MENIGLILGFFGFLITTIGLIVRLNLLIHQNKSDVIELKKDVKMLQIERKEDGRLINELFMMVKENIATQTANFDYIKEDLRQLKRP
jgi:hypothetical protein